MKWKCTNLWSLQMLIFVFWAFDPVVHNLNHWTIVFLFVVSPAVQWLQIFVLLLYFLKMEFFHSKIRKRLVVNSYNIMSFSTFSSTSNFKEYNVLFYKTKNLQNYLRSFAQSFLYLWVKWLTNCNLGLWVFKVFSFSRFENFFILP